MQIRPYKVADAPRLAKIQASTTPAAAQTAASFQRMMAAVTAAGGRSWVIVDEAGAVGYGFVYPVPGVPGVADLDGAIAPGWQRRGFGSRLLEHIRREESERRQLVQLAHSVTDLEGQAAIFLRRRGFSQGHQEWVLRRADLPELPPPSLPVAEGGHTGQPLPEASAPAAFLTTRPRPQAIRLFGRLYDEIFRGQPWYQPYSPAELERELAEAADILFLIAGGEPAGFVWVQEIEAGVGQIEPLGVSAPYRRQGYGRQLLLAGVQRLIALGVESAIIGAWRDNQAALRLYQSLGFQHRETHTYLIAGLGLPASAAKKAGGVPGR